tara:strand:- start:2422 stop:5505 length:3084 start_codon:yes stop_codon:yes gene_type:complete
MAKKRVQVAELQTSTEVRPTISPVDTYVRPAEVQSQPNALQQFVQAITPAVKASEDIKLEEKIKRERRIENGVYKSQLAQGEAAAIMLEAKANTAYTDNPDYFHELATADVLTMRKGYQDKYIAQLEEQNVDPNIIQGLKFKLQESDATFAIAYDKNKVAYAENKLDDQFREAAIAIQQSNAPAAAQLAEFESLQKAFAEANSKTNEKGVLAPDFKRFGNIYLDIADEAKLVDALSPLNQYIKNKKITTTSENFKKGQGIENAAQTQLVAELKTRNKNAVAADKKATVSNFLDSGNAVVFGETVVTREGHSYNRSAADLVTDIDQQTVQRALVIQQSGLPEEVKTEKLNQLGTRRAEFYTGNDLLPPEVQTAQGNVKANFKNANFNDPKVLESFTQYFKALKDFESYGGDAYKGFSEDMKYQIEAVGILSENNYSLQEALTQMQLPPDMSQKITVESADVLKAIDNSMFTISDLDEVVNAGYMTNDVSKVATALKRSMGAKISDGQLIAMAVRSVAKNYKAVPIGNAIDAKFAAVKLPANRKDKVTIDNLSNGVNDILANKGEINRINRALNITPSTNVVATGIAAKSQTSQQVFNKPQFTLHWTNSGNDNMLNLIAMPIDPAQAAGNVFTVTTVDLTKFDKNVLDNVTKQHQEKLNASIDLGLIDESEFGDNDYMMPDEVRTTDEQVQALTTTVQPKGTVSVVEAMTKLRSLDKEASQGIAAVTESSQSVIDQLKAKALADAKERGVLPEESWSQQFDSILDSITGGISDYIDGVKERSNNQAPSDNPLIKLMRDQPAEEVLGEVAGQVADVVTAVPKGLAALNEALISPAGASTLPSESRTKVSDMTGDVKKMTGNTIAEKASNLIKSQEGFDPNPYPDGKDRSVGYGFYLPALEQDELALIKDVENITQEEADAVMALKTEKINTFIASEVPSFDTLPEEAQLGVISMAYQLGAPNVKSKWPSFMKALKEAATAPEGSEERKAALKEAAFNMLYNRKSDGSTTKTKWHTQTPKRAKAMAAAIQG